MRTCSCFVFEDPGPCPVDDTPHTACTPESVALQQLRQHAPPGTVLVVPVARPAGLPPAGHTERVITTKTYRRDPPLRADRPKPKPLRRR